ncbi:substrate-binding domain-containing protein [Kineococcus siccus]|uniref:substrate-binding domain-containing protein n=1 Tax=Kineococcus siccus TaxID=2696567 RepID=UPI00196B5AD7
MPRPSIYDVAALAGVSAATVSRSLGGKSKVAPETRQRVLDAAQLLSYVASPQASGLASGRTRAIGVVVPFVTRWFFSELISGVTDVLRDSGYDVVLYHLGSARDRDSFFSRMPLARRVDGVLTCSMPLTDEHTLALRALDLPYVSIGSPMPGRASVGIDEVAAVGAAVNHLVHLGHTRIGYLAGEPDDADFGFISAPQRRRGFELAVAAAGLEVDPRLQASGRYGTRGGASAMASLLAGPVLPTAVVAEYDELALGALLTLRRAGLDVPGDLSVVGVDDHEMAEVVDLSTVGQDVHEQGVTGARLLLQQLDGAPAGDGGAAEAVHVLATRLVLRGSTAPPAGWRTR